MVAHSSQLFSISLLLFLISAQVKNNPVEGSRLLAEAKEGEAEKKMMMERAMIGSRPPSCAGRCRACDGHCEAVEVPLGPSEKQHVKEVNSRGDEYSSNYKPMNWKCKCGDVILNP